MHTFIWTFRLILRFFVQNCTKTNPHYPCTAPSMVSIMHQVSRTIDSITLSWSQPDQPNGVILDYELQHFEKVITHTFTHVHILHWAIHSCVALGNKGNWANSIFLNKSLDDQSVVICCIMAVIYIVLSDLFQNTAEFNSSTLRSQTNTAVVRGLKPGTIYVFQVRARTVAGFGRFSGKMYFQTMTEGMACFIYRPLRFVIFYL